MQRRLTKYFYLGLFACMHTLFIMLFINTKTHWYTPKTIFSTERMERRATERGIYLTTRLPPTNTSQRNPLEKSKLPPKSSARKVKIVVYSPRQGRLRSMINSLKMGTCIYRNCEIYSDFALTNSTIDADAVVFQGNNMPGMRPVRRDADQVLVFLNNEPPVYVHYTNLSLQMFHNFFNWTMTYRTDSDIPLLYGSVIPKSVNKTEFFINFQTNSKFKLQDFFGEDVALTDDVEGVGKEPSESADSKNYSRIFRDKLNESMWIVSHCTSHSKREKYVDQMRMVINVDQFGKCNNNSQRKQRNWVNTIPKGYKFFLAFENSLCDDYLTEKVYNWFSRDIVLVVRGGCNYSKFLPRGTYIDASHYNSPIKLAEHLAKLGANEQEYIKYLKRKDRYKVVSEKEMVQFSFCKLCAWMNNKNKYKRSVTNIYTWWHVGRCRRRR